MLIRTCWSHTPTKLPTAGEIVELLNNNPRLVSPCIDVPLASVQIERMDSEELIRKARPNLSVTTLKVSSPSNVGHNRDEYSPMHGPLKSALIHTPVKTENETAGILDDEEHIDMKENCTFISHNKDAYTGSKVPSGYIVLDHSHKSSDYYNRSSVGSL
jgi:hypothetical protein